MEGFGDLWKPWQMDADIVEVKDYVYKKIMEFILGDQLSELHLQQVPSLAREFERLLWMGAASKEEYMDMNTLGSRILFLCRNYSLLISSQQLTHQEQTSGYVANAAHVSGSGNFNSVTSMGLAGNCNMNSNPSGSHSRFIRMPVLQCHQQISQTPPEVSEFIPVPGQLQTKLEQKGYLNNNTLNQCTKILSSQQEGSQLLDRSLIPREMSTLCFGSLTESPAKMQELYLLRKLKNYLNHGRTCSRSEGQCPNRLCSNAKKYWIHISNCQQVHCRTPNCLASRNLWKNHGMCHKQGCLICGPTDPMTLLLQTPNIHVLNSSCVNRKRVHAKEYDWTRTVEAAGPNFGILDDTQPVSKRMNIGRPLTGRVFREPKMACYQAETQVLKRDAKPKSSALVVNQEYILIEDEPNQSKIDVNQENQLPVKVPECHYKNCGEINTSRKHVVTEDDFNTISVVSSSNFENLDDIQHPSKRMNVDNPLVACLLPALSDSCFEEQHESCNQANTCLPVNFDCSAISRESCSNSVQGKPNKSGENMKNGRECTLVVESERVEVVTKQVEAVINQESPVVVAQTDLGAGTEDEKGRTMGVSLTELFTPKQIKEHIISLKQCVCQSQEKAEGKQAMEHLLNENSCQLCSLDNLFFEPLPIYCSSCGSVIKRNATYYTTNSRNTSHYLCGPCFSDARSESIKVDGLAVVKATMKKKKNSEQAGEKWVQCDKCGSWQHQVCALFNARLNAMGQAEYTCPSCYLLEVEREERKPLPQSAVLGANDLPRTNLSNHLEQRLFKQLKQERQERARALGKNFDEVPGAEGLVIRVVSSLDRKLEVKQRFFDTFKEENYAMEFPYKSKAILLFQKIEGVDVCLFGMFVQEFGSECPSPNTRHVYLSYLDSVKYFRPEIRTVSGVALRTFVYHEILIGYLDYCKKRGFTSCFIWVCPPMKGDDYILYCHPKSQKAPKSNKLRKWYLGMLHKAAIENIVVNVTNLYDQFFACKGESKKLTAAHLPYFDGDYWPSAAEDMIANFYCTEDSERQKKGKTASERALKADTQEESTHISSKDDLLMQKIGQSICAIKDDFIVAHMQQVCSHCCRFILSGKLWVCNGCKNFHLCEECYAEEQKLDIIDKHPIKSREKHDFSVVPVDDVSSCIEDKDENLENEFFDTRKAFLGLCQGNHYQFDTLRKAKHSSMMVLYHLHNPTAPAFVNTCNVCHHDIEAGQSWQCNTCPDYNACSDCYKNGGVSHEHTLTAHPSIADHNAQTKEAHRRQVSMLRIRELLDVLLHATKCVSTSCQRLNCLKIKALFRHGTGCKVRHLGGCKLCKKIWHLIRIHARACKESDCHFPRCKDMKQHLMKLQQQHKS